jgi:branched-chain amino acid transport system ATP-binding protein
MLEIKNLMVFYENSIAVNNITMSVKEGTITGIFGANSAGKSSLMKTISGIILDQRKKELMKGGERITLLGSILFQGKEMMEVPPHDRAKMGIVLCPERRRIFPESTVLENLQIGGILATRAQGKKTMDYIFTVFPALKDLRSREGGFLSGGEQQMLAIGRALMAQPKLLILDEPLLGLSPLMEQILVKAIRDINRETHITTIVAEQYARPILPMISYGYVLENGGAVVDGTSEELMDNPDVKAAYFGM